MHKKLSSNTAVIYFSLSPWKEARQKSFVSGRQFYKNFRIAGLLRDHTKQQIDQTGLPYFVFDEHNQEGDTFGEKFVSAFDAVFGKGFDNVIAVGNDTPGLQSDHILNASGQLENELSDIVLGPASDGGTWLMGFSRSSFDGGVIKDIAWNSEDLLHSIFEQLGDSNQISLLEKFDDLDSEEDLRKFLHRTQDHHLLAQLKNNIRGLFELLHVEFHPHQDSLKNTDLSYNFLLRGPPSISDLYPFKQ